MSIYENHFISVTEFKKDKCYAKQKAVEYLALLIGVMFTNKIKEQINACECEKKTDFCVEISITDNCHKELMCYTIPLISTQLECKGWTVKSINFENDTIRICVSECNK